MSAKKAAFVLTLLASAWIAALLWITIAGRIAYRFDLEWMEGGMLLHVARLHAGEPIYVRPGPDFTPFLYPPLYPQLLAWLAAPSLPLARAVSLAGVLAAAGALLLALRRERVAWFLVLGALAAFLSCFDDTGGFFDVARADGMALGLASWAVVLGTGGGRRGALPSALLLFLACATKQSMALCALPIAWSLARCRGWRDAARFGLVWGGLVASYAAWMSFRTQGWFWVYVVQVPALHGLDLTRLAPDPERRMLVALPVTTLAALALLVGSFRKKGSAGPGSSLVPSLLTLIALAILMRAHRGGYYNVLMPGFWALSAAGALGAARFLEWLPGTLPRVAVALLFSMQVVAGGWKPATYIPSQQDEQAAESVVEAIRARSGTLFAPEFPTFARAAGRWPGSHIYALADLERPGSPWLYAIQEVKGQLAAGRYDMVLTSDRTMGVLAALRGSYRPEVRFDFPDRVLFPRSGFPVRPATLWVRASPGNGGAGIPGTVPERPAY